VDSDGDGLFDSEEADLGTDPANTDSDTDGLSDGDEVNTYSTDPLVADSDGDTYIDSYEIMEDTDPNNADSRIYVGYWPYNPTKDEMEKAEFKGSAAEGDILPWFAWTDQFGDTVDIYDFANQGKLTVVDLSGMWCYYCQEVAKMIEGKRNYFSSSGYDEYYDWVDGLEPIIADGSIQWVTVLDADWNYDTLEEEEVADWYAEFENPYVPVLADVDQEMMGWLNPYGYPTIMVLDENMELVKFDNMDYTKALDYVMKHYDDNSGTE